MLSIFSSLVSRWMEIELNSLAGYIIDGSAGTGTDCCRGASVGSGLISAGKTTFSLRQKASRDLT